LKFVYEKKQFLFSHIIMKVMVLLIVAHCSLIDGCQHFGKTCCLHLQGESELVAADSSVLQNYPSFTIHHSPFKKQHIKPVIILFTGWM
jgi:hypothetical protein